MAIIHDNIESAHTQTDFHETTKDNEQHVLQTQFLEFKRYTFDKLANSRSEKATDEDNYLSQLLRSLEHRIISLKRQLENKQRIIKQLVAGHEHIHPVVNKAPMGIHNKSSKNENIGKTLRQNGR